MILLSTLAGWGIGILKGIKKALQLSIKGVKGTKIFKNPRILLVLLFEQLKWFLFGLIKGFLLYFLIGLLCVTLFIGGTMLIVSSIASFFGIGDDSEFGDFKALAKEWQSNLTEEDLQELELEGMLLHPQNLVTAIEIEEQSVPQDNITKRKVWRVVHNSEVTEFLGTDSTPTLYDHNLALHQTAYPYRTFFEAIIGIDILNLTSDETDNREIVEKAKNTVSNGGLQSEFEWSFDYTTFVDENGKTHYNIDYNSFEFNETIWESHYFKQVYSGSGCCAIHSVEEWQKDERYEYPLPYLKSVKTMFKDYTFEYERVVLEEGEWELDHPYPHTVSYTWQCCSDTDEEGNTTYNYSTQIIRTWNKTRRRVEKDLPLPYVAVDNVNFVTFLDENNIETDANLYLLEDILLELPNSQEFLMLYSDVLDAEFNPAQYWTDGNILLDFDFNASTMFNNVPLFLQTDSRWANVPYGRQGTIKSSGCGPTSMAMVITAFNSASNNLNISAIDTDRDGIVNPVEMANWSVANGHRSYAAGTYWSLFAHAGRTVGLNVTQVGKNGAKQVINALSNGALVIASMGPGEFTRGGHFIVLTGIDENGKIRVNDPNSIQRSNTAYNFHHPILSQAKQFWIISP